ncbi:MAG TPA: hypothetical protein VMU24_09535 [Candidatus Acidoferrales bacterium]|nr:hypothetical protein [Candidatus Acidoferrales bacterium]
MNPLDALAGFVLGKLKQAMVSQWVKLIFELSFSAQVSFLFVCGTALLATRSVVIGCGSGMVMSALCMTVLFRRSPLTKGMIVVLPAAEAEKEMSAQFQTIERK